MNIQLEGTPKTTRELMFKIAGDIQIIRLEQTHIKSEIANLKKENIKAGSLAGAIVGGVIIAMLKLIEIIF